MQLPDLPLKDLPKGWILDLDGTLVVHNGYKTGEDTILPGVKDFFQKNVKPDDYVLIISARFSEFKGIAEKCLDTNGIRYDKIIYDTLNKNFEAKGNVLFKKGSQYFEADEIYYELENK